jgi:Golgi casein kinase Fam20
MCIALELTCAAGALGGVWFGVSNGLDLADDYLSSRDAAAATPDPALAHAPRPARLLAPRLDVAVPGPAPTVYDAPDDVLLAPLAASAVKRVKVNHGGTSLSLRLDFASGARAAFKAEQIHPQSDPRREIAAYRIDRWLGVGHVPPAKAARFTVDELIATADPAAREYTASRIAEEAIAHDGRISGVVSWWIPEIRDATIGGVGVDDDRGMAIWQAYLHPGVEMPDELRGIVTQLASCVVFDVLIDNADRWSGSNTKASPDNKTLYFMDNTLSFSPYTLGHESNLIPLQRIEVFPRRLVERLRALRYDTLEAMLTTGDEAGLGPLLAPAELHAILARRDHMVRYIDQLIAKYGEASVLALP